MKRSFALLLWILPVVASAQGEPSLVSVVFNPATVTGGSSSSVTITISAPAPANGFDVTLSIKSTVAQLKSSTITIGEKQSSQVVPVTTNPVASSQVVTLTASASGSSKTTTLTVLPNALSIVSLQYPSDPVSGARATRSISLNTYARAATIVEIYAIGPDMLQQNSIIGADTIHAGQMRISRTMSVPLTDRDRAFEIVATLDGKTIRRSGTLRAPTIVSLAIADSVFGETTTPLTANLNGTPPSTGLPVVITSSDPSAITSPGAVSLTSSGGSIGYTIRANAVSSRTPVTLSVERGGEVQRLRTTVIPRALFLSGITASPTSVRPGQSVTITATITSPAPPGGTVVKLIESPDIAGFDVPTTILIPQGATSKSVAVITPRTIVALTTDIRASLETRSAEILRSVRVTINP